MLSTLHFIAPGAWCGTPVRLRALSAELMVAADNNQNYSSRNATCQCAYQRRCKL
jgi:hypothetical protein